MNNENFREQYSHYSWLFSVSGASCKIHRTRRIFPVFAGRSGRRSGRRGPELRDAEYLIDRECHQAEHEVAFDFDRAAHAHGPCAESAIHDHSKALGHAPIIDRNFRAQHEAKAEWAKEVERMKLIHMPDPDDVIFDFRTLAERVNARLKDRAPKQ